MISKSPKEIVQRISLFHCQYFLNYRDCDTDLYMDPEPDALNISAEGMWLFPDISRHQPDS